MATIGEDVRIERGSSEDIGDTMIVMEAAFGKSFGEAWTRSQLAGILPMNGVSLMLARTPGRTFRRLSTLFPTMGRSLTLDSVKTSPTEAELAAMAFEASADTTTVVCSVFNCNWKSRRTAMGPRSIPVNDVVLNPVSEALTVYELPG